MDDFKNKVTRLINTKEIVNIELAIQLAKGVEEITWLEDYYIKCFDQLIPFFWNVNKWDNAKKMSFAEKIEFLCNQTAMRIFDYEEGGIPNQFFTIAHLERVNIIQTKVQNLPLILSKINKVKDLEIRYCHLKEIPIEIREFKNLEVINLSNNSLKDLPDFLIELPNLKKIHLHANKFTDIPHVLKKMDQLKYVGLKNNKTDVKSNDLPF